MRTITTEHYRLTEEARDRYISITCIPLLHAEWATELVYPPNWLERLLGDTWERRLARARAKVIAKAERSYALALEVQQQFAEGGEVELPAWHPPPPPPPTSRNPNVKVRVG